MARLRHRDDPDAGEPLVPVFDEARILDSHDGGTIYTISRGEGPVVVFCHGVTLSSRVWAKQFETFPAAGFRTVAFDSRGHGESVVGDTGHSLDNLADDLRTVLEALDLRDAVLVGHSMGGMAVQAFAIRHPGVVEERVAGLVLLSSSSHNLVSDAKRVRGAVERVVNVGPDVGTFMRQRNLGLLLARIGFGDDPNPSHVEATARCWRRAARPPPGRRCRPCCTSTSPRGCPPSRCRRSWSSARPTRSTPPRDSRRIAELVPGARLVEYPGGGHMLMYERTDEVDALIMDFARSTQTSDLQGGDEQADAAARLPV